jgi:hypothetical protein
MIVTHLKTKLPTRLHERDILQICTDQLFFAKPAIYASFYLFSPPAACE